MSDLLKRKPEKREVLAINVPASTKRQWAELMKLADEQGFDLTGSISTALVALIKQAKGELERHASQWNGDGKVQVQEKL